MLDGLISYSKDSSILGGAWANPILSATILLGEEFTEIKKQWTTECSCRIHNIDKLKQDGHL